jgi:D-sedoheptulose 7-phosphate isomerase
VQSPAIFVDRDGVINSHVYNAEFGTVDSPNSPEEFTLNAGVTEAIREFNRLGFVVIVTSNQPGIAKGQMTPAVLQQITIKMQDGIAAGGGKLDAVYYCVHHPDAAVPAYRVRCDCRKPLPGMLLCAARDWNIDLSRSYMIGDGIIDIAAGRSAGTRTIFIGDMKLYVCDEFRRHGVSPDSTASDLLAAARIINNHHSTAAQSRRGETTRGNSMTYIGQYLDEAIDILKQMDVNAIESTVDLLLQARERGGRVFFLGVGGGAGHASHAVCDFRKIGGMEAYAPTDNVSELTARTNDDGWESTFANWLRGSRLRAGDVVFVFSVGGGDVQRNISANLVRALQYAKSVGATICGVVGRDGGYTAQVADACVLIQVANPATVTPHTESFQALVWHLVVSHPRLKTAEMKWESVR